MGSAQQAKSASQNGPVTASHHCASAPLLPPVPVDAVDPPPELLVGPLLAAPLPFADELLPSSPSQAAGSQKRSEPSSAAPIRKSCMRPWYRDDRCVAAPNPQPG